jgi:hypothetical protein
VKLSRISIYSFICFLFLTIRPLNADSISAMLGVYDFTSDVESEFYTVAFNFHAGWAVNISSKTDLEISTGLIYSSMEYNTGEHDLIIIPLSLTYIINFDVKENEAVPFIGAGVSGFYKKDKSERTSKTYNLYTYGYHFLIGIKKPVSEMISFKILLKDNIVMNLHPLESINISGINMMFGIEYKY